MMNETSIDQLEGVTHEGRGQRVADAAQGQRVDEGYGRETQNQRRPIIGIVPTYKVSDATLDLPDRYVKAVVAAGGAPVVLPFHRDTAVYEALLPTIDGFLLSGGQDIDPVRYGEAITYGKAEEISPGREEVEYLVLSFARQYDVPVLGICRGMQMINVAFGGTLWQDLDVEAQRTGHWQTKEYACPTHHVQLVPGTQLEQLLGVENAFVNSMHHQGIRDLGAGLRVAAYGEDGLVEAVEAAPDAGLSFMVGVQWHPEFFVGRNSCATDESRAENKGHHPCGAGEGSGLHAADEGHDTRTADKGLVARDAGESCIIGDSATPMIALFEALIGEARKARCREHRCNACLRIFREECGSCFPLIKFDD